MAPYFADRTLDWRQIIQPATAQASDMAASITLDQGAATFTNLDVISGKLEVRTNRSVAVNNIIVKLEGESRSRLTPPTTLPSDRPRPLFELHKIMYKIQVVFPPDKLATQPIAMSGRGGYTLPPGVHVYRFSFKLPFNNACIADQSNLPTFNLGGLTLDMVKAPSHHIKNPLPPSFAGFPGEADIRYFVKATIARPSILRENVRCIVPFNFCTIEPARADPASGEEVYARRKHNIQLANAAQAPSKGFASLFSSKGAPPPSFPVETITLGVEARLPQPPVLTLTRSIPVRISCCLIAGPDQGYTLHSVQLQLVSFTTIRAQGTSRTEARASIIFDRSNMSQPMTFTGNDKIYQLDQTMWQSHGIAPTAPPSFEACNISRRYEVLVRLGVSARGHNGADQTTYSELRMPVSLYSGIKPSAALLQTMAAATGTVIPGLQSADKTQDESSAPPAYSEAPPSYETAMAEQGPATGFDDRPQYRPPANDGQDTLLHPDSKS